MPSGDTTSSGDATSAPQAPTRPPPPAPSESPGRGSLVAFLVAALALSVCVGVVVGLPDYLPTNDGPEHVFGSHAVRRLDDASLGYGRYLQPGATFSQVGFDQLFGFFDRLLGWRNALRACLVVMALVWAWGVVAFVAAVGGRRRVWLGLFGFAAAVQWALYLGLFPFYLATGFGFFVLALALWRTDWTWRWRLLVASALTGQAFVHPFPALFVGCAIVLLRAWQAPSRTWLREAGALLIMGAPAAAVTLSSAASLGKEAQTIFLPLGERLVMAGTAFMSGPAWRVWTLPAVAVVAAGLALAARDWRRDRRLGAILSAGLLFALVATLGPANLAGWELFNMRLTPLAAVFWVSLLPVERWPRRTRLAGLAFLLLFAVASNGWALAYNLRLRAASSDLLSGLDAPIRRAGLRLPLIIEPRAHEPQALSGRTVPYCTPNWKAGALFTTEQGGVPAWAFIDNERLHPAVWRWPPGQGQRPPRPERGFEWTLSQPDMLATPGARKAFVVYLLSYAPYYQDVVFFGRPEETAWLRELNFAIDYERGGLAIARFQGCPATLELAPGPGGHSPTIVYFGWGPATQATFTSKLPALPGAQTPRLVPLSESPCGELWLRILFDQDADGTVSPGDSTCLEVNPQGLLTAKVTAPGARVLCHPGRTLVGTPPSSPRPHAGE